VVSITGLLDAKRGPCQRVNMISGGSTSRAEDWMRAAVQMMR
jgi:hypothetical protein